MGFLHKLWDETLAGPTPDSGLGGLRKYDSFPSSRSSAARRSAPPPPAAGALSHPDLPAVTRSITIVRTTPALRSISGDPGSGPSTPSTPSTRASTGNLIRVCRYIACSLFWQTFESVLICMQLGHRMGS
ncbi:hypothetical protein EUGRSUZ_I02133 [Eucalyptus grandis]|uniref:Uncharacterized protein n=2 Tax=Eucalyptus grandis TaxID=71139 RepID=A0ACC3JH45_EUCGR|nr:hypothetical protein EUGRSUZ_I02133 [Eucalyptus grandis]